MSNENRPGIEVPGRGIDNTPNSVSRQEVIPVPEMIDGDSSNSSRPLRSTLNRRIPHSSRFLVAAVAGSLLLGAIGPHFSSVSAQEASEDHTEQQALPLTAGGMAPSLAETAASATESTSEPPSDLSLDIENNIVAEQTQTDALPLRIMASPLSLEQRIAIERSKRPIYTQFLETTDGILIKAPELVDPKALEQVKPIIERMLMYRQDVRDKLVSSEGGDFIIIPKDMPLPQLPEFTFLAMESTKDGRNWNTVRGAGGANNTRVPHGTAIGEETLTNKDVAVHEFGHAIQNIAFTREEHIQWKTIYEKAKEEGGNLYSAYALFNRGEFWAVLSQIYLRAYSGNEIVNTPEALETANPDAHAFLRSFYDPPQS